ncbi:unnamed protein product [Linum trigynum]
MENGQHFNGQQYSVWINTNVRNKNGYEAKPDRQSASIQDRALGSVDRRENTGLRRGTNRAKNPVAEESPLWVGSSDNPFATTEQRSKQGKSPLRFPVPKAPKVMVGKPTRRDKGKSGTDVCPMEIDLNYNKAKVPRRRETKARRVREDNVLEPAVEALTREAVVTRPRKGRSSASSMLIDETALTRGRRLILEEESEDEFFIQKIPSPGQEKGLRAPRKQESADSMVAKAAVQQQDSGPRGEDTGHDDAPPLIPTKKGKSALQPRAPKPVGRPKRVGLVGESRRSKRSQNGPAAASLAAQAGIAVNVMEETGALKEASRVLSPTPGSTERQVTRMGSEGANSDEEDQPFELRRRSPVSKESLKQLARSSKVSQVVRAFEHGLVMKDKEEVLITGEQQEMVGEIANATSFNEYSSNFSDPELDSKKRLFQEVDGDWADGPTPKRQFVEEKDDEEKVEEASLEWPQPVK